MSHALVSMKIARAPGLPISSRRAGLWLLGQAAALNGAAVVPVSALRAQLGGVAFGRVRVCLAPLVEASLLHYTSAKIAGDSWIFVSFLDWLPTISASLASVASDAGAEFPDRSSAVCLFVDPDLNFKKDISTNKQTARTRTRTRTREGAASAAAISTLDPAVAGSNAAASAADLDDNGQRVFALLSDPLVGLAWSSALHLAQRRLDFWMVAGNVFEWLRERDNGMLRKPRAALLHRLQAGFTGDILPADRRSPIWDRHCTQAPGGPAGGSSPYDPATVAPAYAGGAPSLASAASERSTIDAAPDLVADLWAQLLVDLENSRPGFAADWLNDAAAVAVEGDRLVVHVGDPSRLQWLSTKGAGVLRRAWRFVSGSGSADVVFMAAPSAAD